MKTFFRKLICAIASAVVVLLTIDAYSVIFNDTSDIKFKIAFIAILVLCCLIFLNNILSLFLTPQWLTTVFFGLLLVGFVLINVWCFDGTYLFWGIVSLLILGATDSFWFAILI